MTKKHLFGILFLMLAILLNSCKRELIPTPAITFGNNIATLRSTEKNKLVKETKWQDLPVNAVYRLFKYGDLVYQTEKNDTIRYVFGDNDLIGIGIDINNATMEEVIKKLEAKEGIQKQAPNQYTMGSDYYFVGQSNINKKPYIVILNNKNQEITELVNNTTSTNFGETIRTAKNSDSAIYFFMLSKQGSLAGDMLVKLIRQSTDIPNNKYYERIFFPVGIGLVQEMMKQSLQ